MNKRILIVNKFYYPRGGDCIYSMNLERLLMDAGYDVAFFAMKYAQNINSEYARYFASEVNFSGSLGDKVSAAKRTLGKGDIIKSFEAIVNDFKPDAVHLNNIHSYLSPVVAEVAKAHGCKVVWTLHDYKLLCPSYSCLCHGKTCELCYSDKSFVLKNKCMKGSLAASVIAYAEAKIWNKDRLQNCTDLFICPSKFMVSKMMQGGFNSEKLVNICNFVDPAKFEMLRMQPANTRSDYLLYVGRLSIEKGVETLLKVVTETGYRLKIAGGGPLEDELRRNYRNCKNIEFLGMQDAISVVSLLNRAKAMVIPSECYENNPLSVIESLCAGTPVIGARIGGIPELIKDKSGVTFESGNPVSMRKAIDLAMDKDWDNDSIKKESLETFSPTNYLNRLKEVYSTE